jgi:hypothetical protein
MQKGRSKLFGSSSSKGDDVLNENYNEILEFLDEYYGKPHSTPKPISRFKVSRVTFHAYIYIYIGYSIGNIQYSEHHALQIKMPKDFCRW